MVIFFKVNNISAILRIKFELTKVPLEIIESGGGILIEQQRRFSKSSPDVANNSVAFRKVALMSRTTVSLFEK